jgi:hypothetical protein
MKSINIARILFIAETHHSAIFHIAIRNPKLTNYFYC